MYNVTAILDIMRNSGRYRKHQLGRSVQLTLAVRGQTVSAAVFTNDLTQTNFKLYA